MSLYSGIRIVLADDDADDRELFSEAVSAISSDIILNIVEDGMQLMTMLNAGHTIVPTIIFIDLNMPGKNGKNCLKEIRDNEKLKHIPVIIYSTSSNPKDIDEIYKMGASFYICKPNTFVGIIEITRKVILLDWNKYKPEISARDSIF